MRGKGVRHTDTGAEVGITPAYAGKSSRVSSFLWLFWDHPRMCGEKKDGVPTGHSLLGSPPRMRGKVLGLPCLAIRFRITPACAGKRSGVCLSLGLCRDHPRMCGEKGAGIKLSIAPMGSPPHMRGKDPVLHLRQCLQIRPDHARHLVHLSFLRA